MVNKAIFLLAGASSRFREIIQHKCLLRICGQMLLERQIIQAANLGVRDFVFGVGAAAGIVQTTAQQILERHQIPYSCCAFVRNSNYATTQNGHTLELCQQYSENTPALIFEGDIVISELYMPWKGDTWYLVNEFADDGSYVFLDDGYIVDQRLAHTRPGDKWYKSAGIYYLQRQLPEIGSQHRVDDVFKNMHMKALMFPLWVWHEIDTIGDFECAKDKFTQPVRYQIDPALI